MNNTAAGHTFTCRERERENPIMYLILDAQIVVLHNDLLSEFKQTLVLQSPLYKVKQKLDNKLEKYRHSNVLYLNNILNK